jgi:hypothetical protein
VEHDEQVVEEELYEIEVLDGVFVEPSVELTPSRPTERSLTWVSAPALQTAAVAATGFVAGAATFALLRRYANRAAREAELVADGLTRRGEGFPPRRGATYLVHVRPLVPPPE